MENYSMYDEIFQNNRQSNLSNLFLDISNNNSIYMETQSNGTNVNPSLSRIHDYYSENMRLYNENIRLYQQNIQAIIQEAIDTRNTRTRTQNRSRNSRQSTSSENNSTSTPVFTRYVTQPLNYIAYIPRTLTRRPEQQLQDVIVSPSEREIALATRVFRYSSECECNMSCPISLEDFQEDEIITQIKYCNHAFKESAINRWFLTNVRCPVCRYDIREYSRQPTDVSNNTDTSEPVPNTTQPAPITETTTNASRAINSLLRTLANGLSGALDNYIEDTDVQFNFDLSNSDFFEFEFQST